MSETKLPDIADELRSICFPFMIPGDTRTGPWFGSADLCHRAAAEITRLRAHAGWHEAREAARIVHDTFKRDIEQGFVTKDKQFAIDILGRVLLPPGGDAAESKLASTEPASGAANGIRSISQVDSEM